MGFRYVIAGESQCNIFAEICLIADHLQQNLPNFCYDRIKKSVAEWKPWLSKINEKNKWHHIGSPIIWKEVLMAGSKPFYIGNGSDFLEYCQSYYKLDIYLPSKRFENLVDSYGQFQDNLKQENKNIARLDDISDIEKSIKTNYKICISGAANPLTVFIISGLLEYSQQISKIFIYDENCSQDLMKFVELECSYVKSSNFGKVVKYIEKLGVALSNADLLIILDYIPFRSTYSIGEWLFKNRKNMEYLATTINATALSKLRIVLPNLGPACYNASILAQSITKISKTNIVVTTSDLGLDVTPIIAEIAEVPMRNMFCPPVWGFVGINHLVDIHTTIHKYNAFDPYERYSKVRNSTLSIGELTPEMRTMEYLMFDDETLWKIVTERKIQKKRANNPLSINKAMAVISLVKYWFLEPNPNYVLCLGIHCNGTFGLTFEGIFSQPARFIKGEWQPASKYFLPKDPCIKLSYLQDIAEIVMNFKKTDLPQLIPYSMCICKVKNKKSLKKNDYSKIRNLAIPI